MIKIEYNRAKNNGYSIAPYKYICEFFITLRECQRFFKKNTINCFINTLIITIDNNKYNFVQPGIFESLSVIEDIEKYLTLYGSTKGLIKIK